MFLNAVPVTFTFGEGDEGLNRHVIFKESLDSLSGVSIRITAADYYRLRLTVASSDSVLRGRQRAISE